MKDAKKRVYQNSNIDIVETRRATLVSQKKFNNPKNAKIRLNKWHFAKIKKRGFIVLPDSFQWFVKPCQQVCHIHFLGE